MKRRELLIVFLLAVLVTWLSWFYKTRRWMGSWIYITQRGFPIYYWENLPRQAGLISGGILIIDVLFWFLILAMGWWVMNKLRSKKEE